ncbi:MAG: phosphonate ABC transporter, permease protein PhnE [Rhodovulum sp.]
MTITQTDPRSAPDKRWELKAPYDWRAVLAVIVLTALLGVSSQRMEVDVLFSRLGEAVAANLGFKEESAVGKGLGTMVRGLFPIAIAEQTPVDRIPGFDADNLPMFAYVEEQTVTANSYDVETMQRVTETTTKEYLVKPFGYVTRVAGKMVETIEMAIWATILSILLSVPLAIGNARNYTPNRAVYFACRATVSFLRSLPELIVAMFLVLAFGFGPVAGFLALGLHAAGFLGKFYAEDIEDADRKPQEALEALGAGKLRVLRAAVLPQVFPSYVAYTLYILDRNVRMATVVGLVGAGGIGQELKGRFDMFQYDHVGTILVAIFLTVFALDQISARLRSKLIG